jgi:adenylate kinase family enzyme
VRQQRWDGAFLAALRRADILGQTFGTCARIGTRRVANRNHHSKPSTIDTLSLTNLQRVNVVGTSGSGKSTFAKQLAELVDAPYIEMDRLYHKPNWEESTPEELVQKLNEALKPDRWILDGNYHSKSFQTKWSRATCIVWLDMSFTRTITQAFGRAITRIRTKRELWPGTGNRETFRKTFLSRDSVLLWTLTSYHRVRRRYETMQNDRGEFNHVRFIRLRGRAATDAFLNQVSTSRNNG